MAFLLRVLIVISASVSLSLSEEIKSVIPDRFRKVNITKVKPEWLDSGQLMLYIATVRADNGGVEIFVLGIANGRTFFDVKAEFKKNGRILIPFQVLFKRVQIDTLIICSLGKIDADLIDPSDMEISKLSLIAK